MSAYVEHLRTTTFAVLIGTGGYLVPAVVFASNDVSPVQAIRPIAQNGEVTAAELITMQVRDLESDFGLGRDQMADLLGVSRPTVYSWLNGGVQAVRQANQDRVYFVCEWLRGNTSPELRPYLGGFLRRSMDPQVQEISDMLTAPELDVAGFESLSSLLNFKLEGARQSAMLDDALSDKPALI